MAGDFRKRPNSRTTIACGPANAREIKRVFSL